MTALQESSRIIERGPHASRAAPGAADKTSPGQPQRQPPLRQDHVKQDSLREHSSHGVDETERNTPHLKKPGGRHPEPADDLLRVLDPGEEQGVLHWDAELGLPLGRRHLVERPHVVADQAQAAAGQAAGGVGTHEVGPRGLAAIGPHRPEVLAAGDRGLAVLPWRWRIHFLGHNRRSAIQIPILEGHSSGAVHSSTCREIHLARIHKTLALVRIGVDIHVYRQVLVLVIILAMPPVVGITCHPCPKNSSSTQHPAQTSPPHTPFLSGPPVHRHRRKERHQRRQQHHGIHHHGVQMEDPEGFQPEDEEEQGDGHQDTGQKRPGQPAHRGLLLGLLAHQRQALVGHGSRAGSRSVGLVRFWRAAPGGRHERAFLRVGRGTHSR
mmetsp:Transcript_33958/g.88524  ORF Transcript_33958/g.88524 Transcript_33958/m.88524 type:complete len:382 (+) Transcript_33958:243-1388(+)